MAVLLFVLCGHGSDLSQRHPRHPLENRVALFSRYQQRDEFAYARLASFRACLGQADRLRSRTRVPIFVSAPPSSTFPLAR
jgi:hypothetical protein